jgi:hypothetical protein
MYEFLRVCFSCIYEESVAVLWNYMQNFDEFCVQNGDVYGFIVRN